MRLVWRVDPTGTPWRRPDQMLLLSLVLWLVTVPAVAMAQARPDSTSQPSWRVIHDAPYRVIPAQPALQSTGETLTELDVQSVGQLIDNIERAAGFLSAAFSLDGGVLASGSRDETVKLWDVHNRVELSTLLSGKQGNWVWIDHRQRVWRGDDGTLLKKRVPPSGNLRPVPVHNMSAQDQLSIAMTPPEITVQSGKSADVSIRVSNTGTHPAYWLRLQPSTSADEAVRLIASRRLFTGKGRQEWQPARIAKLDPGETATLYARVIANLKFPAQFIRPGRRPLELTAVSANGTEVRETIYVHVASPVLEWQKARLDPDGKTFNIGLSNTGTAALSDFTINLELKGFDRSLPEQAIPTLEPAQTLELAFALPDGFEPQAEGLTLRGRTRELPIYAWSLSPPDIETASRLIVWLIVPFLLMALVTLYYLRRYRHPLVVQLTGDPTILLQLPFEQLREARMRLQQTRRMETVLSKNEISQTIFQEGIAFVHDKAAEQRAQWLARRLGGTLHALPHQASQDERLPLWELHLPDEFPLNVDRCLLGLPSSHSEPQDCFEALRSMPQTSMHITLLIGPSLEYQARLYDRTKDPTNKWVATSGPEVTRLLLSPHPQTVLANLFAGQLALTQLSPYQLGGGVNRETVFFGRREIIAHIVNRELANYLIVSGRQLSQSSLLKALERRYEDWPEITCHYLALSNQVLTPRLASALKLPRGAELEDIADHVAQAEGQFLFLIDEADKFIAHELENDYATLDALRRMSEEGHCHFILAGFWELYQHAIMDYQSPLKNFAETIQLGALEANACRQLATEPMRAMRLEYANPSLLDEMLATTG